MILWMETTAWPSASSGPSFFAFRFVKNPRDFPNLFGLESFTLEHQMSQTGWRSKYILACCHILLIFELPFPDRSKTLVLRQKTTRRRNQLKMLCCFGAKWKLLGEDFVAIYTSHVFNERFWFCCIGLMINDFSADIPMSTSITLPPVGETDLRSMPSCTNTGQWPLYVLHC